MHKHLSLMSLLAVAAVLSLLAVTKFQAQAQTALTVCPDPAKPCLSPHKTFAGYELSFRLPAKIKPNVDYKSAPFYAVLCKNWPLTNADDCDQGEFSSQIESERRRAQALVPTRKAFANNQCPDMGAVSYRASGTVFNKRFIAVYGGTTRKEAEQVRAQLKTRYPTATIAQMQVVFQRIVQ